MNAKANFRMADRAGAAVTHDPTTVTGWQTVRRAVDAKSTILNQRTFKWLATLPRELRPMESARRYPRIVNRLCDLWPHCEFTRLHFQSLLIDRRGDRRGLPAAVRQEIESLQDHYFRHISKLPELLWKAVPVNEPKIPDRVFAPVSQRSEIEIVAPK